MSQTILLIEDNEDNRIVYSTILRHFGYEVMEAQTGEDGIAMAERDRPDLILMDVGLPGIDGWQATTHLKRGESTRHIPVIALTAHAMSGDREKALEAGADEYDTKPVDLPRLLSKINRWLPGEKTQAA